MSRIVDRNTGRIASEKRGVYFLSNDFIYELTIAFLNSFRKHNPTIPLCLIPFDDNCERITMLADFYNFDVFIDKDLFEKCSAISHDYHGHTLGTYRKCMMWEGCFDQFIYIDVDTVVLENLDFVFDCLADFDCLTSHSNMDGIRKFVWNDTVFQSDHLSKPQIDFAANTGFITSKRGFIDIERIIENSKLGLQVKQHMVPAVQEQSWLNYIIVTAGKPYNSLYVLSKTEKYKDLMHESWGGQRGGRVRNGKIKFRHRRGIFIVHWAGIWRPTNFDWTLYRVLNRIGLSRWAKKPVINNRLPYKKLWKYYRDLQEPPMTISLSKRII